MPPLRILHTIASWRWTGAAEPLAGLALHQQRLGHEVWMACVGGSSLEARARQMGLRVVTEIDFLPRRTPLALWAQVTQMTRFLETNAIDVIHSHISHDHWVAGLGRRRLHGRPPLLARSLHRLDFRRDPLHNWLFRHTDLHFGVTRDQIARMKQAWDLSDDRTALMRGAIDIERFRPGGDGTVLRRDWGIPPDAPIAGMIGRMRPDRGHMWLLDAAPLVLRERPDLHVVLCGRGDLKEEVRRRVRAMPERDNLIAPGYVPMKHLTSVYHAFNVVLYLGIGSDKTSRGLLEAMASARPIIAVRDGAVPDMIEDGVSGVLVNPGDTEGLARAILALLGDPARAAAMGAAARHTVEAHYREDARAADVCTAYERLLSKR